MGKVIALVSKSKRLHISLHNTDCDVTISDDHKALLFQTEHDEPITSINLQLNSCGPQRNLIQSYDFACHSRGRMGTVRVDSVYPMVFEDSEQIDYVTTVSDSYQPTDVLEMFELRVKLIFEGVLSPATLTRINSATLTIESAEGFKGFTQSNTTVSVSKEVLGSTSDYFSTLFYGDFKEKSSGSYCIKEVDDERFIWLVKSLTERKWKVTSVDQAFYALFLADRFCMKYVKEHILPYLKAAKFRADVATLQRYIDIVVRCGDSRDAVSWIFEKCQSAADLTEVAHSCGTALNPHLEIFFKSLAKKHADEEKKCAKTVDHFTKKIHCVNEKNRVLSEENHELTAEHEDMKAMNDVLVDEIARLRAWDIFIVLPTTAILRGSGGKSVHTLINAGSRRFMYQCLVTHGSEYFVSSCFGFLDAGASMQMAITRVTAWPSRPERDREDKYYIKYAPAPEDATDARRAFEGKEHTGEVVLLLKAE